MENLDELLMKEIKKNIEINGETVSNKEAMLNRLKIIIENGSSKQKEDATKLYEKILKLKI